MEMRLLITSATLEIYFDDWKFNPIIFQYLSKAWGPFTVDCFALDYNCELLRFHSKFCVPKTEAVDTFTVNWSSETCWLVPPLYLVGHALLHAEACKARGALVLPLWKSAAFWPLCPYGHRLAPFFMPGNHFQFLMVYFYLADVVATLETC